MNTPTHADDLTRRLNAIAECFRSHAAYGGVAMEMNVRFETSARDAVTEIASLRAALVAAGVDSTTPGVDTAVGGVDRGGR